MDWIDFIKEHPGTINTHTPIKGWKMLNTPGGKQHTEISWAEKKQKGDGKNEQDRNR